jgi:glycerol uptake facilitator-like aquaporin
VKSTAAGVALYITGAYWFTSSTSFANPAVTFARMWTDTFAGIAPHSVSGYMIAQLIGLGVFWPVWKILDTPIDEEIPADLGTVAQRGPRWLRFR